MKFLNKTTFSLLIFAASFLFYSCDKDVVVALKIYGMSNATDTSCIVRGTVNATGIDIVESGFLVTTRTTLALTKLTYYNCRHVVSDGSLNDFTLIINGLSADSTYRIRVFSRMNDTIYYGSSILYKPLKPEFSTTLVRGGVFNMGATQEQQAYSESDEYPVHRVTLSDFLLGTTEVTNEQFTQFLKSRVVPSSGQLLSEDGILHKVVYEHLQGMRYSSDSVRWLVMPGFEHHPAIMVTWYGAREYCRWAGGRLPTEAEWEWAARGGVNARGKQLSGGDLGDVNDIAWYRPNTIVFSDQFKYTQPVATKLPNELGIYDMSGNVSEWVQDWYLPYLSISQTNPNGMSDDNANESGVWYKVIRGGSWSHTSAEDLRISRRDKKDPALSMGSCGIRFAKSL
jgi:formylglycine-generating enzyme required for sulfatase activity